MCNGCTFGLARDVLGGVAIVESRAVTQVEMLFQPVLPLAMSEFAADVEQDPASFDDVGCLATQDRAQLALQDVQSALACRLLHIKSFRRNAASASLSAFGFGSLLIRNGMLTGAMKPKHRPRS